jgi:hypothetical protein
MNTPTAIAHADNIHAALGGFTLPADVRVLLGDIEAATDQAMTLSQRLDLAVQAPSVESCKAMASGAIARLIQIEALATRTDDLLKEQRQDLSAAVRDELTDALALFHADTTAVRETLEKLNGPPPAQNVSDYQTAFTGSRALFASLDDVHRRIRRVREGVGTASLERQKALLSEALAMLYRERDGHFATLMTWHNKTTWLMSCGLLLMAAIGLTLPNAIFFLVGAAGGLLSRLSRTLVRDDVPHDYGVSWVPLFLSPVMGALSAWAGILVLDLLRQWKVLGQAVDIDWGNPYHTATLAIAFALGFAERLFDTFMSQLQETITRRAATTPRDPVAPPASTGKAAGGSATAPGGSASGGGPS